MIHWLLGSFQKIQSAFNTMIYRVGVSADIVGPVIVNTFRGN